MTDFTTSLTALPAIIPFAPGVTSQTFSVSSVQDNITEGTECLYFALEPVDDKTNVTNFTSLVCIEDDDGKSILF